MTAFMWTVICLYALGVLFCLTYLGEGKYPRTKSFKASHDAFGIVLRIALILWALHVLGWGPQ